ncbi:MULTISPECIES: nucleoside-diphosphate sugar epimerase/dehydratase [unclassified Polaromonas]|jgi:FlaA1/EpsC-like NDP-sugar epimerase|uniref:polysaccharide biosynthesis protein n=1 Tax=unclassified Polaromonas TaxID=2638319 RepID=UPI0025F3BC04|nr:MULTISPECIES: nucleoside-diphosphate sugar epimerase/dehydratase [unclassified Polaromonas]
MILSKLTAPVLNFPRLVKRLIVLGVDVSLCLLSTLVAFYLRVGTWIPLFGHGEWTPLVAAIASVLIATPIFIFFGLYREVFRHSGWAALLSLIKSMAFYGLLFFLAFTIVGFDGVPRTIGIIQPIVLLMLVGGSRGIASYWLSNAYRRQLRLGAIPKVLIYGAGNAGLQLSAALSHSYQMRVIGFLDDDPAKQGQTLLGTRVYNPAKLCDLIAALNISGVLLAIPTASRSRRNQILQLVKDAKISVQTLPSMSDLASGKISMQDLRPLDVDDLLGRELVLPDSDLLNKNSFSKTVMITGAGGSIGSELCRQIIEQTPKVLLLVDQSEYALYQIYHEMMGRLENRGVSNTQIIPLLASVTNQDRMRLIVSQLQPDVIYHAAAYKHVPLVEANVVEGIRNNALGTLTVAQIALELGVPNFILISTDKAVRPTNVMGASKRLAEMILQALAQTSINTKFSMVRFGNVLNSSGSVVPKFRQQIKDGGPVTVTDFRMTRYFMTIPEAAQLVIQAGALSTGGDMFLLDMGEPVKIIDLARKMIELSGLDIKDKKNPQGDVEIEEIGLRPGEKLYEELLISGDLEKTLHPRIFKSNEEFLPWSQLGQKVQQISQAIQKNDDQALLALLKELVSGYKPESVKPEDHL